MSDHLGGYLPDGDPATWYPDLWSKMVKEWNFKRIIDVGCGNGLSVNYFRGLGAQVLGIEGTEQTNPLIVQHDYTTGMYLPEGVWDAVWCCEFVEHVEAQFIPNFIATFQSARVVFMTHAFPDQPGTHHVNCQDANYWIDRMRAGGFLWDPWFTDEARKMAAWNEFTWTDEQGTHFPHFVRSGLVFVKE